MLLLERMSLILVDGFTGWLMLVSLYIELKIGKMKYVSVNIVWKLSLFMKLECV